MKKKAIPDLVALMQSMSKAEKRVFRLERSKYKSSPESAKNYLRIYTELSRNADSEASADMQEYLLGILIESLTHQQRKSTLEIDWRDQLSSVMVMHRRGLEKKAFRVLEKLLLQAGEAGAYEFGLEVIGMHMLLVTSIDEHETLQRLVAERKRLLNLLLEYQRYDELMLGLFAAIREADMTKLRQYMKRMQLLRKPSGVRTLVHRYHLLAHGFLSLLDYASTEKYHDIIQQLFEAHPLFLRTRSLQYIMTVLNNGILAWQTRNQLRMEAALVRLRQLPKSIGPLQAFDKERITRYLLDLSLRCHLLQGQPGQNLILGPEIKQALARDKQMEQHRGNYLRYCMALSCYCCGRNREALQWLQPIIDNRKDGYYNQKIFSLAFLLRAACHYQQGNEDVADGLMQRFRRNKFFAAIRKSTQFSELSSSIASGYKGENWWF